MTCRQRRRSWVAAAIFILVAAWGGGAGAAAIGDILQAVIRDADIQTRAPLTGEDSGKALPRSPAADPRQALPEPPRAAVLIVLVLLGFGALLLIGWLAVAQLRGRGSRPARLPVVPMAEAPAAIATDGPDLEESERLAQGGDFSGAIHLLLLRALGQLARLQGGRLPRSLTSREILRRAPLPGGAGAALAGLVAAVETSHFGGAAADEATYRLCRDSYRQLSAAAAP